MQIPVRFRYRIERRQAWGDRVPGALLGELHCGLACAGPHGSPEKALMALARLRLRILKPSPSAKGRMRGEGEAVLPLFAQGKARFIERAWALQVQAADVALALGITRQEAARLFDLAHPTNRCALQSARSAGGSARSVALAAAPKVLRRCSMKTRRGRTPKSSRGCR